jgi:hypothetical protein
MTRKVTAALLVSAAALLIIWDVYVAVTPTPGDTISEIVLDFGRRYATLPLALGVVMGHVTWPVRSPLAGWTKGIVLAGLGIASLIFDLHGHTSIVPVVPFAFGVVVGHFVWGQRER